MFRLAGRGRGADQVAVAQHGDRVRELEHLAEEVGDQDDRRPARDERADGRVQLLRLAGAQRRGRLVHDDQLRVARERAQDLDLLLLARAQPAGRAWPGQLEARAARRARRRPRRASGRAGPRRSTARRRGRRSARRSAAGRRTAPARSPRPCARAPRAASGRRPARRRRRIRPPSGASAPETMRPSVDLPAPFSPTRAWTEPRAMSSETPPSAWTPPKCLATSRSCEIRTTLVVGAGRC